MHAWNNNDKNKTQNSLDIVCEEYKTSKTCKSRNPTIAKQQRIDVKEKDYINIFVTWIFLQQIK